MEKYSKSKKKNMLKENNVNETKLNKKQKRYHCTVLAPLKDKHYKTKRIVQLDSLVKALFEYNIYFSIHVSLPLLA